MPPFVHRMSNDTQCVVVEAKKQRKSYLRPVRGHFEVASIDHYDVNKSFLKWLYLRLELMTTNLRSWSTVEYRSRICCGVNILHSKLPSILKSMGLRMILTDVGINLAWAAGVCFRKKPLLLLWCWMFNSNFMAAISKLWPRFGNGWACSLE